MTKRSTNEEFIGKSKRLHGLKTYTYDRVDYKNNRTKVELKCNKCNLYFKTRPTDHTSKMYGCNNCSKSKSEKMAISIIREILKLNDNEFKPVSPKEVRWLGGLYLDGYSDELKLGLEYQGIQHYEWPNYYHKTKKDFDKQQKNDKIKCKKCIKNNVKLIVIPYTISYRNREKMYNWIYDKILIFGFIKK